MIHEFSPQLTPVITSGFTAAVPDESRAVVAVPPDVMSEVPASKQAEGCRGFCSL